MKIIIFSDSHGCVSAMADVVNEEKPDWVFHLGDCWEDAQRLELACPGLSLIQVPGNCDFGRFEPLEQLVTLGGHTFLLGHGHTWRVKSGLSLARKAGVQRGAEVVFFGHTHQALLENGEDVRLFNPGAMSRYGHQSYGRMTILGNAVKLEHCDL